MLKTGNGWTKLLRTLSHDEERVASTARFKSQTFREPKVTFIALCSDEVNGVIRGTKPFRPLSLPHNLPSLCSRKGHLLLRALQWFQHKIKDIASHLGLIESVSISERAWASNAADSPGYFPVGKRKIKEQADLKMSTSKAFSWPFGSPGHLFLFLSSGKAGG